MEHLSRYDEERDPAALRPHGIVSLPLSDLMQFLRCPVCLSVFTDPYATVEVRIGERRCLPCPGPSAGRV
jgi:hypothetical protein